MICSFSDKLLLALHAQRVDFFARAKGIAGRVVCSLRRGGIGDAVAFQAARVVARHGLPERSRHPPDAQHPPGGHRPVPDQPPQDGAFADLLQQGHDRLS